MTSGRVDVADRAGLCVCVQDTAAATQALSVYALARHGVQEVNLHCNVTTRPTRNYTHSFDFNVDNAITPKSLSNVSLSTLCMYAPTTLISAWTA